MRIDHCFLGDCRNSMREMLASGYAGKIQCIVTSPPYWGLRDYGVAGQLGQEVAQVAQRLGRHWIGCELNPEYIDLQHDRTRQRGLVLES